MKAEIVDYETAFEETLLELDRTVRTMIKEGYQPFGNLIQVNGSSNERNTYGYVQPMVKYKGD